MTVRCPSCGRYVRINRCGGLRLHRRLGTWGEKCRGLPVAPPKPASVSVVLQLSGGRVFRCDVPLGLTAEERTEVATAMRLLHESMQSSYAQKEGAASAAAPVS